MRAPELAGVVAALAAAQSSKLRTVTLAFDEYVGTDMDEAPLAEEAARLLGSEHTTVRIRRGEFEALLDDFLDSMDQPTIDGLNTYLVSHAAAKLGLKVVLSGLGGDELFGGYPSFRDVPELALTMPKMSMTMEEGTMVAWLKQPGDAVRSGEPVCEVATDKVDMEVESPFDGVLARIVAEVGKATGGQIRA